MEDKVGQKMKKRNKKERIKNEDDFIWFAYLLVLFCRFISVIIANFGFSCFQLTSASIPSSINLGRM